VGERGPEHIFKFRNINKRFKQSLIIKDFISCADICIYVYTYFYYMMIDWKFSKNPYIHHNDCTSVKMSADGFMS
jgi:hypothetical protein